MFLDLLYKLDSNSGTLVEGQWDLSEDFILDLDHYNDYREAIKTLRQNGKIFDELSVDDLLNFFDTLSKHWVEHQAEFLSKYIHHGFGFLMQFCQRSNLEPIMKESLKGNIYYLDDFIYSPTLKKKLIAHPRGVITHWLAGNVPVLGTISLIQGILSKNVNVLKLPRENGLIIPELINKFKEHKITTKAGKTLSGEDLAKTILFTYCDRNSRTSQQKLSFSSDVRVAWGGLEAVKSVLSLAKRPDTQDVIFGPKYSLAIIGRNSFKTSQLDDITYKLAIDASVFDQQGCNAPHTVFIERGGEISPEKFAEKLAEKMELIVSGLIPKGEISPDQAIKIQQARVEYAVNGTVYKSKGIEWTVVYSQEKGLAKPFFSRVIFVRPIDDINETINYISHKNQTLGLSLDEERKNSFAKKIARQGIDRITDVGRMSQFNYPWDGMFPIEKFVRWTSIE